jgi:hypothetical protein
MPPVLLPQDFELAPIPFRHAHHPELIRHDSPRPRSLQN